jgi:DNA-binding NtrC family response regulator
MILKDRKILLVEDDKTEVERMENLLAALQTKFSICQTIKAAEQALRDERFDFLLSDLHIETKAGFERPDGLELIAYAREQQPNLIIIANSSDPRADIWSGALAAGAQHFIRKPILRADELVIGFGLASEKRNLVATSARKKLPSAGHWSRFAEEYPEGLVIDKTTLSKARGLARRNTATCVLMGESGTGKEEVARLVHRFRCQAEGQIPFVAVNCATIAGNLMESLLFGHRKGAFTGADKTTNGFVADANGGILFLDEIHTLDIQSQQKLLRVLENGTYNRVGETKTDHSRFQLITATTKDLDDEVEAGRFMLDLRHRITMIDVKLPPLRERPDDIEPLIALFLAKKEIRFKAFDKLCSKLKGYYWQGNIRQLFKALESWILHCEFADVPLDLDHFPESRGMLPPNSKSGDQTMNSGFQDILKPLSQDADFEQSVDYYEKSLLTEAIKRHHTLGEACKALNMSRSTLDARRRKYNI